MTQPHFSTNSERPMDPALVQALESLSFAQSTFEAQIALNIIIVILEHQIESDTSALSEELLATLHQVGVQQPHMRDWYDLQETLRSAIQLLQDCPEDVQPHVIPMVSQMVHRAIQEKWPAC